MNIKARQLADQNKDEHFKISNKYILYSPRFNTNPAHRGRETLKEKLKPYLQTGDWSE
ncbi:MAG: hypothetical protein ABSD57_12420 [Verrucomicrobiota bacterium]